MNKSGLWHRNDFRVDEYSMWVLSQIQTASFEYGYDGLPFRIDAYDNEHICTTVSNYSTHRLLDYIERKGGIKIELSPSGHPDIGEIGTPHGFRHSVVKWYMVTLLDISVVGNIAYELRGMLLKEKMILVNCNLELRSRTLYLFSPLGRYTVWRFQSGSIPCLLMRQLLDTGHIKRRNGNLLESDGKETFKIGKLDELLRTIGFDKKAKKSFFAEVSADIIRLKPRIALTHYEHDHFIKNVKQRNT